MKWRVAWCLAALSGAVAATPAGAQFLSKPTRPQVETPRGPVRQIILKNCSACHGIDDYAYNALDRAGWNALIDAKHNGQPVQIQGADREILLDWIVSRFGPSSRGCL